MQKMRLHPDLGGDETVAKELNEAVATLCNPDSRAAYDKAFFAQNAQQGASENPSSSTASGSSKAEQSQKTKDTSQAGAKKRTNRPAYAKPASNGVEHVRLPGRNQCPFCHASRPASPRAGAGYPTDERCAQCKAAATPIEDINSDSANDLRKVYRHDHNTSVWLWTQWPVVDPLPATMTDLSIAGCAIESVKPIALQSIIVLDTRLLNGICQVRYCKQIDGNDTYSLGLEFLTLDIAAEPGAVFSATA